MHSSKGILSLAVMLAAMNSSISEAAEYSRSCQKKAVVLLHPTKGNRAQGVATFTEVPEGIRITVDIAYLEPGRHGFQIHEYADCSSPDGKSIGPIYNPQGLRHGSPYATEKKLGDLGNIVADEVGHAYCDHIALGLTMDGPNSIIGRSLAIHANADDMTSQPNGNVGGCVACGVIE